MRRVEKGMTELKNENRQLKQKLDSLDSHSRRNNLIIQGIPENQNQESGSNVKMQYWSVLKMS